MKIGLPAIIWAILLTGGIGGMLMVTRVEAPLRSGMSETVTPTDTKIKLPPPARDSDTSLEKALQERRSVRVYQAESLSLSEIAQLLWAAQGVNRPGGYRTAPSAGALYPLGVYVVAGQVDDLPPGVYRYSPHDHDLTQIVAGDQRPALSRAALGQDAVEEAAAIIVLTAVYERTTVKYGERGIRYVQMEVGSAAQNVYLQTVSLDLGTVFVGAFHDTQVKEILHLGDEEDPLCLLPVGHR